MSEWFQNNAEAIRGSLIILVALVVLYFVLARLARRLVRRLSENDQDAGRRAATLWGMLRRLVLVVFLVTGALGIVNEWGVSIAPFLAVGSAVGIALGFGAQDLVRDVISGFFILAEDQYHIDDVVRVAGVAGKVEEIRPRVTVLRDLDGNVHYVPNGEIKVASNLTQEFAQVVIDVRIGYEESIDRAMDVLGDELGLIAADPEWSERIIEVPEVLGVDALNQSEVIVRVALRVVAEHRWLLKRHALARIKRRLDAEGIAMPYQQIRIHRAGD